jgi:hypothetical protein
MYSNKEKEPTKECEGGGKISKRYSIKPERKGKESHAKCSEE